MYFGRHGSLDRLLVQGRWASSKTARIYINEGPGCVCRTPCASQSVLPTIYQVFDITAPNP